MDGCSESHLYRNNERRVWGASGLREVGESRIIEVLGVCSGIENAYHGNTGDPMPPQLTIYFGANTWGYVIGFIRDGNLIGKSPT